MTTSSPWTAARSGASACIPIGMEQVDADTIRAMLHDALDSADDNGNVAEL